MKECAVEAINIDRDVKTNAREADNSRPRLYPLKAVTRFYPIAHDTEVTGAIDRPLLISLGFIR